MKKDNSTQKLSYRIEEFARATNMSVGTVRNAIRRGELKVRRVGRVVLITAQEAARFLGEGEKEAA